MSVTNVKRKSRNESEKRRRDAFNRLINELTVLVANGDRKMDKSNVLKCAISFLKDRQPQAESTTEEANCPSESGLQGNTEQSPRELARIYMDALNAGTFCISCSGTIHQISANFASLFGYSVSEMLKHNFLDMLEDDSERQFEELLSSEVLRAAATSSAMLSSAEPPIIETTVIERNYKRRLLMVGKVKKVSRFHLSVERYVCPMNTTQMATNNEGCSNTCDQQPGSALCFVGVARPLNVSFPMEISAQSISTNRKSTSFTVVYNKDFICLHADYSCGLLLGYSRLEMLGTCGYDYVHVDDLDRLTQSHQQLMQIGVHQIDPHRFRTKANHWVWLQCTARIEGTVALRRIQCIYSIANQPPQIAKPNAKVRDIRTATKSLPPIATSFRSEKVFGSLAPLSAQNCDVSAPGSVPPVPVLVPPSPVYIAVNNDSVSTTSTKVCSPQSSMPPPSSGTSLENQVLKTTGSPADAALVTVTKMDPKDSHARCTKTTPSIGELPLQNGIYSYTSLVLNSQPVPSSDTSRAPASTVGAVGPPGLTSSSLVNGAPIPKRRFISPVIYADETSAAEATAAVDTESSTIAIPSTYRQLWEELQRKSDFLRQQVLQKEIELQQLQFKQFFATCHNAKPE